MKTWRLLVLLGSLMLAMSACSAHAGASQGSSAGTHLVIAVPADEDSLDPAVGIGNADLAVIALMYQQLTTMDPNTGEARPGLARSWRVSPDGLAWTFSLRRNARFSDGTRVTAQSVVYSFQRILRVGRAPSQGLFWMKDVTAPNGQTVRFDLRMPFPELDRALAIPSFSIVNPAMVAKHVAGRDGGVTWLSEHSAGSGPYELAQWQRDQNLELARVPGKRVRFFDYVDFKVIPDASSRRLQLQRGDVDLVTLGAREVSDYGKLADVSLLKSDIPSQLYYLTLNTSRKPLNDRRVRRAIAESIDYAALINDVLSGNAVLLRGPIPPGVPGYDPSLPLPRRNVADAKRLLRQAGFGAGITLNYDVGALGPVSELIQADLKDAGITLRLQQLAPSAFAAARASGDFDLMYDGFSMDFPDPADIMNNVFVTGAGENFSRYSNPKVDLLLNAGFVESNPKKRVALFREAQRIVVQDTPIVLLYAPDLIQAYRSSVHGLELNPYEPYEVNAAELTRSGP